MQQDSLAPTRPIRLFARPEPVEAIAEVPDGPPVQFTWRRMRHVVAHAEGPERIAMEWWRDAAGRALTRDYFRVESREGVRVWLFREGLVAQRRADALVPAWRVRMSNVVEFPGAHESAASAACPAISPYAELAVTTNFSFLRGASHPEELVRQASGAWPCRHRHRGPQQRRGRGAGLCGARAAQREYPRAERDASGPCAGIEARRRRAARASPTARPTFSPIRRTAPHGDA